MLIFLYNNSTLMRCLLYRVSVLSLKIILVIITLKRGIKQKKKKLSQHINIIFNIIYIFFTD